MMNNFSPSTGNLVFEWMCANKKGSIRNLIDGICWIARCDNSYDAREWLYSVSALGHCDLDWKNGRWRITSPRLIRLPNSDGAIAYIGFRKHQWNKVISDISAFIEDEVKPQATKILPLPPPVYFQIDSHEQIEELCQVLEAEYFPTAAFDVADSLVNVNSTLSRPSLPPAFDTDLEKLEIENVPQWVKQLSSPSLLRDGVYRVRTVEGKKFLEKIGDEWYRLDSSIIYFRDFVRQGRNPFEYVKDPDRPGMGDLFLPRFLHFPVPHLRALTFCSGRLADVTSSPDEVCFANIPEKIFEKISTALMS